jgi:hypothetical protein
MLVSGQKSEPAYYFASNFMPPPEDRADARYGTWTALWATKYGNGRVLAHADSTQFSNFSTFEPGKPESFLGMMEWLNRRNGAVAHPRMPLAIVGCVLLVAALAFVVLSRGARINPATARNPASSPESSRWLITIAAGMCGFALSAMAVRAAHSASIPPPKPERPMIMVGIDRTVSDAILSKGGFIGGRADGFGIFERWILRLGWFIKRESGPALFDDKQLVVFFAPSKDVPESFKAALVKYVEGGGRVLVIDMPENYKSTANSLLKPFGMELRRAMTPLPNEVKSEIGLPKIDVPGKDPSFELSGAKEVLATAGGKPVAGMLTHGKGTITAVGFGSRFTDTNMGVTGDVIPGKDLRAVYDVQYGMLRHLLGVAAPTTAPTSRPATTTTTVLAK